MAITIRRAETADLPAITQLFYDTITTINAADYTPEQVAVWRAGYADTDRWQNRLNNQYFILAEEAGNLCGFGSVTADGYIDVLYVHKDYQRKGIAGQLATTLDAHARQRGFVEVYADVSLTARPFFAQRGFKIVREQQQQVGTTLFTNYRMVKRLQYR